MSSDDLRCVKCAADLCSATPGQAEARLACPACGAGYGEIWGIPYFGDFEAADILGLIEMAANAANRGHFGIDPPMVERWERLLADYDAAADKARFVATHPEAQQPHFMNRYGEWSEISSLTRDTDLQELKVLDMGAGLGFDSHRLAMRGARVTALEFSPLLAEAGKDAFPHIRWIGGFSHLLPFRNASFDAVFCNAALHHMRDIPAAISEALRVLRPGGVLITTCDSFRPAAAEDDVELTTFDSDASVLLGVNETIPRFSDFVSTLERHPDLLEVDLFTHTLYNAPSGGILTGLTRWDFARDREMLAQRSGSLAMRVRLREAWPEAPRCQADARLPAAAYAAWLTSDSVAIARLAPLMADAYVDLPFPGERGTKFELLNGWRLPRPFQYARTAYRRGRWFLRRPATADALVFEVGLPKSPEFAEGAVEILLDGRRVGDYPLSAARWTPISVDLTGIPVAEVFALEIRKSGGDDSLAGAAFVARHRRLVTMNALASNSPPGGCDPVQPAVFAVIPVFNRLYYTRGCIEDLRAQSYAPITIVVSDGGSTDGTVETIREAFPDVVVLTSEEELWWAGAMAAGIDHALRESRSDEDFVLMMNNDTEIPPDYVATLVSASRYFNAAVGSLIVDSSDATHVLDAGEYVRWSPYSFPLKTAVEPFERFCDDVDVLPGRGSLVPLRMIRTAGNVDARRFPHYLSDYEFFYRLQRHGFHLGVCYETSLRAHIQETGIVPSAAVASLGEVLREAFSRRSMVNVVDHWRFIRLYGPPGKAFWLHFRLVLRVGHALATRTSLRWIARPIWIPVSLLVRLLLFVVRPGPIDDSMIAAEALTPDELISAGVVRRSSVSGWYIVRWGGLARLLGRTVPHRRSVARLMTRGSNPLRKVSNTLAHRRATQRATVPVEGQE